MDVDAFLARLEAIPAAETTDVPLPNGDMLRLSPFADARDWRNFIAPHPARPGSAFDAGAGYNVDAVVGVYPLVQLVHGDEIVDAGDRWPAIAAKLHGSTLGDLASVIWALNARRPEDRVAAAGKASAGAVAKKRRSRASSASPSAN